jgi:hypothetical protein
MSLIPAFDGLATAITDELKCLSHFAIGLIGGFLLCFSQKSLGSSSSEAVLATAFKRRGSRDRGGGQIEVEVPAPNNSEDRESVIPANHTVYGDLERQRFYSF